MASVCNPDAATVLAVLPSFIDYRVSGAELYLLSSDERSGSAWAELEVAPASGGPSRRVLSLGRYAFALEVGGGAAYLGTRATAMVLTSETYEDWEILRLAGGASATDTVARGNFFSFYLGEAGLLVRELDPARLQLYPQSAEPRAICPTRSLLGALQRGDRVLWWNHESLWVCPLEGGAGVELGPGEKSPDRVQADATHVYWAGNAEPGIHRLALAGNSPAETLLEEVEPSALALDAEYLYFAAQDRLQRLHLGDRTVEDVGEYEIERDSLVAAGDHLYFTQYVSQFVCIKRLVK